MEWTRRQFSDHAARTVFAIFAICMLASINIGLFMPEGPWWRDWGDQREYLTSARALLGFDLAPGKHIYPLLYALSAAPFAWMPAPFVPVNLACYALAFWGFLRVARRFGVGDAISALLFLAATLGDIRIAKLWIVPWTTTLSTAAIWMSLGETADMMFGAHSRPIRLGMLLMLVGLVRPTDLLIGAIIGGFALWRPVVMEKRWRMMPLVMIGALAVLLPYVGLYAAIYGWRPNHYMVLGADYGFAFQDLAWKASVLLVDPASWFPGEHGLLREMPWLLTGSAGLVVGVMRLQGAARWLTLCMALSGLFYTAMMLTYVDLVPTGVWRFANIHYFKWLLPMAALFTWLLLTAWRDRLSLTVLAVLVLCACFRIVPRPAMPEEPAKALAFAAPDASWRDIYFARSVIVDARGVQRSLAKFHQLPVGDRVAAIAFRRPFEKEALWYGTAPAGLAHWPNGSGDAKITLPGSWPQRPIARYGTKLIFGYPCWAPPFPCDASAQTLAE
jgi:hypothetical protein